MSKPHYEWARAEKLALARFIQPQALPPEFAWPKFINRLDLLQADGPTGVAAQLYGLIRKLDVQYDVAPFNPRSGVTQLIRKPATILAERRGTCLDLAVLYATVCLATDLLPVVIVVDGHAFAGLSLTRTRHDTRRGPKALAWDKGELTDLGVLQELAGSEYVYVECTGLAQSKSLAPSFPEGQGRSSAGFMSFERACDAGEEQVLQHMHPEAAAGTSVQRAFLYALDIHDLQINHGIEPVLEEDPATGQPGSVSSRTQSQSGIGNIQFGDGAQVGEVFSGGKRVVNTAGGHYFQGPIDVNSDFVGGDKINNQSAAGDIVGQDKTTTYNQGDNISVGNITGSTGVAIGRGAKANVTTGLGAGDLSQLFAQVYRQIDARSPEANVDTDEIRDKVQRIETEAKKLENASETKLDRWLGNLANIAPDILEVTLSALAGPQTAAITVIQKVTAKAGQLLGRGKRGEGGA